MVKMVSNRSAWRSLGCKAYICPSCGRDKGMIYLFNDKTLRYVCFCGVNMKINSIEDEYDFDKKKFVSHDLSEVEK